MPLWVEILQKLLNMEQVRPKISIIIPIYNVEKYLDRCMQSVINQTLKEIEIILVDDGSQDKCPDMCENYKKIDSRIRVIHKKNEGLGYARNAGLNIANGEFVAFLDSDDFIDNKMYEVLYNKAKKYNLDTIFCGCRFYKSPNTIKERCEVKQDTLFRGHDAIKNVLFDFLGPLPTYPNDVKYMMSVWHALYSLDIIRKKSISFCSERKFLSEDILFDVDYLSVTKNIGFIPNPLYNYCLNENSLSHTYKKEKYERSKILIKELDIRLQKKYAKDEYTIHLQRFQLFYLRVFLIWALKRKELRMAKDMIKDSFWDDVLKHYPIGQLCTSKRIFYTAIKILHHFFNQ